MDPTMGGERSGASYELQGMLRLESRSRFAGAAHVARLQRNACPLPAKADRGRTHPSAGESAGLPSPKAGWG
jgi:hypothetical protein